jgi:hypothetical protein
LRQLIDYDLAGLVDFNPRDIAALKSAKARRKTVFRQLQSRSHSFMAFSIVMAFRGSITAALGSLP